MRQQPPTGATSRKPMVPSGHYGGLDTTEYKCLASGKSKTSELLDQNALPGNGLLGSAALSFQKPFSDLLLSRADHHSLLSFILRYGAWNLAFPTRLFLPLPANTQTSSPGAKGHSNLLADVLWARTVAANSVKHADCVEQKGGVMTSDVCIHFTGRGIAKVKLTSFSERLSLQIPKIKTAAVQLTTRQQKQSLQERAAGLSLVTHGDFIRLLLHRSKLRWQEIVLKPAFKKEKLQNCHVGAAAWDAPKSSL
ncbi:hypothetical protein CB1_000803020 [Camelus ferus]|nr:hypothetical protein CB1_000803020 [Camelus ferus]